MSPDCTIPVDQVFEITFAFFQTNNSLRFYYQYNRYSTDQLTNSLVNPQQTTYTEHFYHYLFSQYLGWNGTAPPMTIPEFLTTIGKGAVRFKCSTTRVLTLESVYDSLKKFKDLVCRINSEFHAGGRMSGDKYGSILKEIVKMEGIGQLTGQKLLHCACMLKLVEDH